VPSLDCVPDGSRVLVDANILLYAAAGHSPQSLRFLHRCAEGALDGIVTTVILAEFTHRRTLQEAQALGLVASNPARALSERRELLGRLGGYSLEVRDLLGGGLQVEPVLAEDFRAALDLQRNLHLLTNDSLNIAVATRLGVQRLATADRGLSCLRDFTVHLPTDLPAP
jgi:predicted nucleic acid-binding protein